MNSLFLIFVSIILIQIAVLQFGGHLFVGQKQDYHKDAGELIKQNIWEKENYDLLKKLWCFEKYAVCDLETRLKRDSNQCFLNDFFSCDLLQVYPACSPEKDFELFKDRITNYKNEFQNNSKVFSNPILNDYHSILQEEYQYKNISFLKNEYCLHLIGFKYGFKNQKLILLEKGVFNISHNFDEISINPKTLTFACEKYHEYNYKLSLEFFNSLSHFFLINK